MNSLPKKLLVLVFLILVGIGIALFFIVPQLAPKNGFIAWERDFGVNLVDLAVADGKVFIATHSADLYCLNQQNGRTIWKHNFGYYSEGGFLEGPIVADGKVFVGSRGSRLNCLSENTGDLLWQFRPNVSSSYASKSPPLFTVVDGKVFTTGDGFYVVNATDGKLIWGYDDYKPDLTLREFEWVITDGRVFIAGLEDAWYLYSLNADNGEVLWSYKIFKWLSSPPVVADGRVFVWDRWQNQTVLCLNETSGSLLWQCDVGAQVFQPAISDGVVLFGASDCNFYALNESDGALKWKFETGYQNLKGKFDFAVAKIAYGQVFTGYVDTQLQLGESVYDEHYKYEGYVYSLNLSNGLPTWAADISNTAWGGGSLVIQSILLNLENRTLYATTNADIYSLNVENGTVQWMLHFDYWVLPPIYYDSRLFVAADLKVIAYNTLRHPSS